MDGLFYDFFPPLRQVLDPFWLFVAKQTDCRMLLRRKTRKKLFWAENRRNFASSKGTKRVLKTKKRIEIKHYNINNLKIKERKLIMAKTPVSMTIDGYKEREVLMVTYEFNQATDVEGQMAGIPRGGKIRVRVKALNDGTPDLLAWMTERSLPKNGEIKLLETKTNKEMKSIKFTNGYCVDFQEKWEDKMGHFEEITITCKQIEFGNVKYENDWA